jgi:hypothetical protein
MKPYSTYCDQPYSPVVGALPDSEYLAALGDRLMFKHGSATQPKLALFVAPKGVPYAGWVIGVFDEPFYRKPVETMKATPGARFPFAGQPGKPHPNSAEGSWQRMVDESNARLAREGNIQNIAKFKPCGICGGHHTPPDAWEPRTEK